MDANAVTVLKAKFISDFDKLRISLYKGVRPDITTLKYMLCVINDPNYFDSKIYEYLLTV